MYVNVLPAYLYTTCIPGAWRSQGVGSPRTGIVDSCELSEGCWELNVGLAGIASALSG